jgi:hypothetical protein
VRERRKKGDKEKAETKEIELLINPKDEDSTTIKKKVLVLRNPDPESLIIWLWEFEKVCESVPIKEANLKAKMALQFLAGNAKEAWQNSTEKPLPIMQLTSRLIKVSRLF